MKFIRFPEATGAIKLPGDIFIPFVVPTDNPEVAVTCVRLTEQDLHAIKKNNYRLFVIVPSVGDPADRRPSVVTLSPVDPFQRSIPVDGKEN
jgi:hypothetical protein